MASQSSKPSDINTHHPHSREGDRVQEKHKTSPSTETTHDEGENARIARERQIEENAPRAPGRERDRH